MTNFIKPVFKVYLYRYKPDFYTNLTPVVTDKEKDTKTTTLQLTDLGDIKLSSSQFSNTSARQSYGVEFDKIMSVNVKAESTAKAKVALLAALKENYIVQRMQQQVDPLNWLNTYKNDYSTHYKTKADAQKALLGEALTRVVKATDKNTYIERFELTSDKSDETAVIEIRDFVTGVNALDNGLTLVLDANKLNAQNRVIVENDILEVVLYYPDNNYTPQSMFFGFVTNVVITERFGAVVDYVVSCAGLGKYLLLSRIMQNPALVSQFESGVDVYDVGLSPFETLFNNKDIKQIFDELMQNSLSLTSEFQDYADHAYTQYSDTETYKILSSYYAKIKDLQSQFLTLLASKFKNGKDDVVKQLREANLTSTAELIEKYYRESVEDEAAYIKKVGELVASYKSKYDTYQALRNTLQAQGTGEVTSIKVPYQLFYTFPSDWTATDKPFQFALMLLVLMYSARKLSSDSGVQNLRNDQNQDVFALFTGASQYKVYNIMARTAFDTYYSQMTVPDDILSDIRTYTFFEVFEDRPGIIKCRPPRYNIWQGDTIETDNVLDFINQRDDARLLTFMAYKFMFPFVGTVDFLGGKFSDLDLMIKYGLRAGAPRQNPNVMSPELGNFWSAIDLIRANMSTRVVNVVVPATKEYQVGSLYFIPNKGLNQKDITELNPGANDEVGIVGYVNSITTNINYGELSTHTLELIYVRKAKKLAGQPDATALNFTHMPDLETFMQFLEVVKDDWDLTKVMNEAFGGKSANITKWVENPALSYDGYYYAVTPLFYTRFSGMLARDKAEFEKIFLREDTANYAIRTDFTTVQFGEGAVSQELINRLYLLDVALRNQFIPDLNRDTGLIKLDFTQPAWKQAVAYQQGLISETSGAYHKAPTPQNVNSSRTAIAAVFTNAVHHAEFAEFLKIQGTSLEATLNFLFANPQTNMEDRPKLRVDVNGTQTDLTLAYNATDDTAFVGSNKASIYYLTQEATIAMPYHGTMKRYNIAGVEVGLAYIPEAKQYSIASMAVNDAIIVGKNAENVDNAAGNLHMYGLEADLIPELNSYWSLADLEKVLTYGLHLRDTGQTTAARPTGIYDKLYGYLTKPIFDFLNDTDKQNMYVKLSLDTNKMFSEMQRIGKDLGLDITRGVTSQEKVKVTGTFDTLVPVTTGTANSHQYKLQNSELETVHINVHCNSFKMDEARKTYVPDITRPLHFVIKYKNGKKPLERYFTPTGTQNRSTQNKNFITSINDSINTTEHPNWSPSAEAVSTKGTATSTGTNARFIVDSKQTQELYAEWLNYTGRVLTASGALAGATVVGGVIIGVAGLPLVAAACIVGVAMGIRCFIAHPREVLAGVKYAVGANKAAQFLEHPYAEIEYKFIDKTKV